MSDMQRLYDDLCRVLTDFEGNGSEDGATPSDLYSMLVKIQNGWEDCVTADIDFVPKVVQTMMPYDDPIGAFSGWAFKDGAYTCKAGGYFNTLVRVYKNTDFDYLYIKRQYMSEGLERGDKFEYAGIYYKRDGLIYDNQYSTRTYFGYSDSEDSDSRTAEALRESLKFAVRQAVELIIDNDRNNLRVTEVINEREIKNLENFPQYSARGEARTAYLKNDACVGKNNDNAGVAANGGYEFTFRCDYRPAQWTEDSFLEYILNPKAYIDAKAQRFIDAHQEAILIKFLEGDMVTAAYNEIIESPSLPVHFVKRIIRAMKDSPAKTINITINKDDTEFTFKAEAREFRSDCISTYNSWNVVAADKKKYELQFGQSLSYGPEDIVRIEYSRSVLYKKEIIKEEALQ